MCLRLAFSAAAAQTRGVRKALLILIASGPRAAGGANGTTCLIPLAGWSSRASEHDFILSLRSVPSRSLPGKHRRTTVGRSERPREEREQFTLVIAPLDAEQEMIASHRLP